MEHPERLTIIPLSWLPFLVAAGLLLIVCMCVGVVRALDGRTAYRPPALTAVAACVATMWWVVGELDRDLADGAAACLIVLLVLVVGHRLVTPARRRRS